MQKFWNWFLGVCIPLWWAPNAMTLVGLVINVFTCSLLVYYSPDAKQSVWLSRTCLTLFETYLTSLHHRYPLTLWYWLRLDCFCTKRWMLAMGSKRGEPRPVQCWANSSIMDVTPFRHVRSRIVVSKVSEPYFVVSPGSVCFVVRLFVRAVGRVHHLDGCALRRGDVTLLHRPLASLRLGNVEVWKVRRYRSTIHHHNHSSNISRFRYRDLEHSGICLLILRMFRYSNNRLFSGVWHSIQTDPNGGDDFEWNTNLVLWHQGNTGRWSGQEWFNRCGRLLRLGWKFLISTSDVLFFSRVQDTSILSPVIPILLVYCFTVLIYTKSTSAVFVDHLCLYIITFGLVAAKITNKLVVAHMSKSEITKMDTVFIGPALLFFNQYFNFYFDEYHVLWAAFVSYPLRGQEEFLKLFPVFCSSGVHSSGFLLLLLLDVSSTGRLLWHLRTDHHFAARAKTNERRKHRFLFFWGGGGWVSIGRLSKR